MKIAILLSSLFLGACATTAPSPDPQSVFLDRLIALCGHSFEGRITSPPSEADSSFAGKRLVMHVRDCSREEVRIPFNVGDDRSRTWVVSRRPGALRLKHDHRHEDGSADVLTQYGGDTVSPGTAERQEFPADADSRALFVARDIPQSSANIWAIEVQPDTVFAYELRRPGRFFRVEFDLSRPVANPPRSWGQ